MNAQAMMERFEMRLGQSVLEDLDAWRARQGDLPSRSEAVRRLVEAGLAERGEKHKARRWGEADSRNALPAFQAAEVEE